MKAMILAAGMGTRLGALTEHTPKCLVRAGNATLLEHTIRRLISAGVNEAVVNLHHLAPVVEKFLDANTIQGLTIHRSFEPKILETGGAVKKARKFFQSTSAAESFFVHNADVFTTCDLSWLKGIHTTEKYSATLLVIDQPSKRGLLIDRNNRLCGWVGKDFRRVIKDSPDLRLVNFSGIQLCEPAVFGWMEPLGDYFSIVEAYLEGIRVGADIRAVNLPSEEKWFDVGTPERLAALQSWLTAKA